ncbi:MAG: OadG family protein [Lachnospiraceae bacterium]
MKKKIILILSVCLVLFNLAACGQDPKKADYNGTSYDDLNQMCSSLFEALGSLSDEDIKSYEQAADELQRDMVQTYENSIEEAGAFKSAEKECTITRSGKTLTVEKLASCEKRNIKMIVVYNYNDMSQPTAVTVECVYTLGEKMAKAAKNTLIGITIVFCILVLISLIISCFKVIPYLQEKFAKKPKTAEIETPVAAKPPVEEPVEELSDDLELVAVIAAAIAAATDTPIDGFVVRSIKRRK